jgi:hypothetical protein
MSNEIGVQTIRKQQKTAPMKSDPRRIAEQIAEKLHEAGFGCIILSPCDVASPRQ